MNQMNQQVDSQGLYVSAPQSSALGAPPRESTLMSLANDLADEIVTLRDSIGALSKALSPVCLPPPGSIDGTEPAQPQHWLLSLAQLQTLIYQVRHASQDVRHMLAGLRV